MPPPMTAWPEVVFCVVLLALILLIVLAASRAGR